MTVEEDVIEKIQIDTKLITDVDEEGQVIVHCSFFNNPNEFIGEVGVRVWKSTFVIDDETGIRAPLIKAFNICYQPNWYFIAPGETKSFTMIFAPLPKSCKSFTFREIIPQGGAFVVPGISRNKTDVYRISLS